MEMNRERTFDWNQKLRFLSDLIMYSNDTHQPHQVCGDERGGGVDGRVSQVIGDPQLDALDDVSLHQSLLELSQWTGSRQFLPVFDTTKDGWSHDEFVEKVTRQTSLVVLVVTATDDVFGFFTAGTIGKGDYSRENEQFVFSSAQNGTRSALRRWKKFSSGDGAVLSVKTCAKDSGTMLRVHKAFDIQNSAQSRSWVSDELETAFPGVGSRDVLATLQRPNGFFQASRVCVFHCIQ